MFSFGQVVTLASDSSNVVEAIQSGINYLASYLLVTHF